MRAYPHLITPYPVVQIPGAIISATAFGMPMGRSNPVNAERQSLGTKDGDEAIRLLPELDRVRAEDLGLIPRSKSNRLSRIIRLSHGGYQIVIRNTSLGPV